MNLQEASLLFRLGVLPCSPVAPNKAMQTDGRFAVAADSSRPSCSRALPMNTFQTINFRACSITPMSTRLVAWNAQFFAHPKNSEATTMKSDSIVDEVRNNGLTFAARHNNDIAAICRALKEREKLSQRKVVNREPRRLARKAAS